MKLNSHFFEINGNSFTKVNSKENSDCTNETQQQNMLSTFTILNQNKDDLQESFPYYKEINNGRKLLKKILLEIQKLFQKSVQNFYQQTNKNVQAKRTKNSAITISFLEDFQLFHQKVDQQNHIDQIKLSFDSNFDIISNKIFNNEYVFYSEFIQDIREILIVVFQDYFNNQIENFYMNVFSLLNNSKEKYYQKKYQDYCFLIRNWSQFKETTSLFPTYPLNPRFFKEITEFQSVLENNNLNQNNIYSKENLTKSLLKPNCKNNCICSQNNINIGEMSKSSIQNFSFQSQCCDITNSIECTQDCECDVNCKNKQIQNLKTLDKKKQIKMQIVWGIDSYTRKNLGYLLPDNFTSKQKDALLNKIIKNLNHVGIEAWNITKTLDYLIDTLNFDQKNQICQEQFQEELFISKKKLYEKQAMNLIYQDSLEFVEISKQQEKKAYQILRKCSTIKQLRKGIQVHSKGLGGTCRSIQGIQKNTLIEQYQGEIYPIFYWFIKQTAIKKQINLLKKKIPKGFEFYKPNFLQDFSNIQIETFDKEPNGRSIYLVDPLYYGNFASRLSHSCNPNCWAIPTISNGHYSISMYAIKNIAPGEELTFDYCSSTESLSEHKKSICLCGDQICKFYYMESTDKHKKALMDGKEILIDNPQESFLKFNALLLEAENETQIKKQEYLDKYNFGDNTFKNCPVWVRIWASFVLQDIEEENNELKKHLIDKQIKKIDDKKKKEFQYEINNLQTQRVNNLIIAIDKINNFCLQQKKKVDSPLSFLTGEHYIKYLYSIIIEINQSKFFKDNLIENLIEKTLKNEIDKSLFEKFDYLTKKRYLQKEIILQIKYIFLLISEYILQNYPQQKQVSDQFYFMAFTIRYFVAENYKNYTINVDIKKCDLVNPGNTLENCDMNLEEQIEDLNKVLNVIQMYFNKGI